MKLHATVCDAWQYISKSIEHRIFVMLGGLPPQPAVGSATPSGEFCRDRDSLAAVDCPDQTQPDENHESEPDCLLRKAPWAWSGTRRSAQE